MAHVSMALHHVGHDAGRSRPRRSHQFPSHLRHVDDGGVARGRWRRGHSEPPQRYQSCQAWNGETLPATHGPNNASAVLVMRFLFPGTRQT